jgi:putative Ca2+/H+ antiporter (TMEM165/GDT1 family)
MEWKSTAIAFAVIFLAELGDKTQLAAMGLAAKSGQPLSVFVGGVAALVLATLIAVVAGHLVARVLPDRVIEIGSAFLFIGVGVFLLVRAFLTAPGENPPA